MHVHARATIAGLTLSYLIDHPTMLGIILHLVIYYNWNVNDFPLLLLLYQFAGIDDLKVVMEMLVDITSKWQELGLALGLKKPTLDKIHEEHRDLNKCKMEMLSCWLQWRDDSKATCNWQSLAAALKSPTVEHKPIAEAIETKFL